MDSDHQMTNHCLNVQSGKTTPNPHHTKFTRSIGPRTKSTYHIITHSEKERLEREKRIKRRKDQQVRLKMTVDQTPLPRWFDWPAAEDIARILDRGARLLESGKSRKTAEIGRFFNFFGVCIDIFVMLD